MTQLNPQRRPHMIGDSSILSLPQHPRGEKVEHQSICNIPLRPFPSRSTTSRQSSLNPSVQMQQILAETRALTKFPLQNATHNQMINSFRTWSQRMQTWESCNRLIPPMMINCVAPIKKRNIHYISFTRRGHRLGVPLDCLGTLDIETLVSNAGFCPGGPFVCIGGWPDGHYECTEVQSQACQEWIRPSLHAGLVGCS